MSRPIHRTQSRKPEEQLFISWLGYRYSLEPSANGTAYLKLPLVVAVQDGRVDTFANQSEVLKKAEELGVEAAQIPLMVRLAYQRIQVREPKKR